jgi:hypothetical protein
VSGANVASVCGAIFARISMGTFTDAFGPRMGFSGLLTLSSSAGEPQLSSSTNTPWCSCWYTSHAPEYPGEPPVPRTILTREKRS